jgi:hypothetical protein
MIGANGRLVPVSSLPRLEPQRYRPLPSWIDMNRSRCRKGLTNVFNLEDHPKK